MLFWSSTSLIFQDTIIKSLRSTTMLQPFCTKLTYAHTKGYLKWSSIIILQSESTEEKLESFLSLFCIQVKNSITVCSCCRTDLLSESSLNSIPCLSMALPRGVAYVELLRGHQWRFRYLKAEKQFQDRRRESRNSLKVENLQRLAWVSRKLWSNSSRTRVSKKLDINILSSTQYHLRTKKKKI